MTPPSTHLLNGNCLYVSTHLSIRICLYLRPNYNLMVKFQIYASIYNKKVRQEIIFITTHIYTHIYTNVLFRVLLENNVYNIKPAFRSSMLFTVQLSVKIKSIINKEKTFKVNSIILTKFKPYQV